MPLQVVKQISSSSLSGQIEEPANQPQRQQVYAKIQN